MTNRTYLQTIAALERLQKGERGGAIFGECSALLDIIKEEHEQEIGKQQEAQRLKSIESLEVLERIAYNFPGLVLHESDIDPENGDALDVNGADLVDMLSNLIGQLTKEEKRMLIDAAREAL